MSSAYQRNQLTPQCAPQTLSPSCCSLASGQRSHLAIFPLFLQPAPLANIIIHLPTLSQQLQSFSRLSFLDNVLRNQTSSLFQNHLIRYLDRRCTKLERRKRYGLSIVPHIGSGRLHYPSQHLRQPSLPLSCTALLIVARNATVGQNA